MYYNSKHMLHTAVTFDERIDIKWESFGQFFLYQNIMSNCSGIASRK